MPCKESDAAGAGGRRLGRSGLRNKVDIEDNKMVDIDTNAQTRSPNMTVCQPADAPAALACSGRIISVTSALPSHVVVEGHKWQLRPRQGSTALYSALRYLGTTQWQTLHVGWVGDIQHPEEEGEGDEHALNEEDMERIEDLLQHEALKCGQQMVPVWMDDQYSGGSRWSMYASRVIWPLLHYILEEPTDGRNERKWWADYVRYNQAYADKIQQVYQPGDIIWIHDYNLFLLPQILRQRIPNVYIGLFVHAPFPSSEYLRCLPKRKELLEGMLGSNMVGFQSYAYSRHFISSCTRVLGFESTTAGVDAYGAHVAVDVFSIGIDAVSVEKAAHGPGIDEKMKAIRDLYPDVKLIVGRDRLDSVRGVLQKLRGFEVFLEQFPEWRNKVALVQVTSPGMSESAKIESKVSELISQINGQYGSLQYAPIQHYPQHIERDEYYALLRVADLGLITSVRDAMNTTTLEFVICQKDHNSPVILSEFTGTAGSLNDAIQVNPWDAQGVARAIHDALTMPESKKRDNQQKLYKHVITNTVQAWVSKFLHRLLTNVSAYDQSQVTPALDRPLLMEAYKRAERRLFMFDYDGTLTPIVRDPSAAIPTDRIIRSIKLLASDPKNQVWIISGRDQAFLEAWLGDISELGLSAEHGSFLKRPFSTTWENLAETIDMKWQDDVYEIFKYFSDRTQGAFIERKKCTLTWHYRQADPEYGQFQARECQSHLESTVVRKYDVEVMIGKANVEVRPTFINKGEIVKKLIAGYRMQDGLDLVFCAGDDKTDEDMFRVLRKSAPAEQAHNHIFSVAVGASSKLTLATWHVLKPKEIVSTIGMLVGTIHEEEFGGERKEETVVRGHDKQRASTLPLPKPVRATTFLT